MQGRGIQLLVIFLKFRNLIKGKDSIELERKLGYFVLFCSCGKGTVAGAELLSVNGGFRPAFLAADFLLHQKPAYFLCYLRIECIHHNVRKLQ